MVLMRYDIYIINKNDTNIPLGSLIFIRDMMKNNHINNIICNEHPASNI